MPILFTCPHCGTQTNVDDQYAGQSGPCASCGRTITIPLSGGMAPAYAPPTKSSSGPIIVIVIVAVLAIALVCGGILVALLLPAVQAAREAASGLRISLGPWVRGEDLERFPAALEQARRQQAGRSGAG